MYLRTLKNTSFLVDLILFGDIIITQKERKFKQQKKHSEEY
nr:MAG TPA: hypothetical protein [Caudoviricetes sp.]